MTVRLVCAECGAEGAPAGPSRCRACGGLWDLVREEDPGRWSGAELRRAFAARRAGEAVLEGPFRIDWVHRADRALDASGVWRFRELLAWSPSAADVVSLREGGTPLFESAALTAYAGLGASQLSIKHEGLNPTGSFKDRGMTVAVSRARTLGARAVACASTGNTSASLAAYAGRAGLDSVVLVPAGKISAGKLAQTLAYGARLIEVEGTFDDCLRLLDEGADALGLYVANSVNPFRLEGQKTIVFELLEDLRWRAPDWIAFPAGNLGNTAAFGRALQDAQARGLIDRLPRLLAVQAEGAAPFARSFAGGFAVRERVEPENLETVATAIRIGDPASYARGVESIRATRGIVTAVSDAEILAAKDAIDRAGLGCEPASAASLAGVRKLVASGEIAPDARVVAVVTGHLLKDPGAGSKPPEGQRIEPSMEALARLLG